MVVLLLSLPLPIMVFNDGDTLLVLLFGLFVDDDVVVPEDEVAVLQIVPFCKCNVFVTQSCQTRSGISHAA